METVIYVDILFLVNFSMDFLSVYMCGRLLHYDTSFASLFLCAGIGGIYGVAQVFLSRGVIVDILINILVTALLSFIAFGFRSVLLLLRNTVVLYGIGFGLGGAMSAFYYALNKVLRHRIDDTDTAYFEIEALSLKKFIPIIALCIVMVYLCGWILSKIKAKKTVSVHIELDGKSVDLIGMCDSGNLLCEPLSGLPCLVCSFNRIEALFGVGYKKMFEQSELRIMNYTSDSMGKRLRVIPLSTVGSSGVLVGFIPDSITLDGERKKLCVACERENDGYSGYDCIVPGDVF